MTLKALSFNPLKNAGRVDVPSADRNVNNVRSFCATRSESLGRMNVETGCNG